MDSPLWQTTGLLRIVGLLLSGICHQLPEHSLLLAGVQLPLCARCTGTFLGAALGFVGLWRRGHTRSGRLPPPRVISALGLFFTFWAVDGFNSYWHFLTGRVLLYVSSNALRLAAGLANGVGLSVLILPLFNNFLWKKREDQPVLGGIRELIEILLPVAASGLLLQTGAGLLLYPVLLAQVLSVWMVLGIVNSVVVLICLRWDNRAEYWQHAAKPLAFGLLLSMVEVGGIALLRHLVFRTLLPAAF